MHANKQEDAPRPTRHAPVHVGRRLGRHGPHRLHQPAYYAHSSPRRCCRRRRCLCRRVAPAEQPHQRQEATILYLHTLPSLCLSPSSIVDPHTHWPAAASCEPLPLYSGSTPAQHTTGEDASAAVPLSRRAGAPQAKMRCGPDACCLLLAPDHQTTTKSRRPRGKPAADALLGGLRTTLRPAPAAAPPVRVGL